MRLQTLIKIALSSRGFAVGQILIALVVSFLVIYGVLAAIDKGSRDVNHSRHLMLADEAADFIAALLVSPKYCSVHLQGIAVPGTVPAKAANNLSFKEIMPDGSLGTRNILSVGSKFQNVLEISSLDLNIDHQVGRQRYLASLNVTVAGSRMGYFNRMDRSVALFVTTDEAGNVNGCSRLNYQTFSGKGKGEFSKTCDDFAAKGWPSKETCLRDGRWHLVYTSRVGGGTPLYGSAVEFAQYVIEGADSHIIAFKTPNNMLGSYRCQGIEVRSAANMDSFACHEPYRIEMKDWDKLPTSFMSLHGASWFNKGYTNKPGVSLPEPIGAEWYVRF